MKRTLNENQDFRHASNNEGKGKRLGLRNIQDEEGIAHHKKEK